MSNFYRFLILFSVFTHCLIARSSHLLLVDQGDGAIVNNGGGQTVKLKPASFLPLNQAISIRPRSGIETMAAGYQFRFGAETNFTIQEEFIEVQTGSIFFQSRKMGNSITFNSPESSLIVSGIATCMLEVETNGGIKILVLLGRAIIKTESSAEKLALLPGELTFVKPGSSEIADIININLERVVSTSFLVSGFKNSDSFLSSINSVVQAQQDSIGKTYRAEVGDAKTPDSFEVIAIPEEQVKEELISSNADPKEKRSTSKPSTMQTKDPLSELLGRPPVRFSSQKDPFSAPAPSSTNLSNPRPFPGSLLRKSP